MQDRRPNKPLSEYSDDTELMQAVEESNRLQREAQALKLRLNVAPVQLVTEMMNEVRYLGQQLQAAQKDNRALKGVAIKQKAGISAIEAVEASSQYESLKAELAASRDRFAQLKQRLAQESQTSATEHKRYLDADRKLKQPKAVEEVKVTEDHTKHAQIFEKAFKTAAKQTEIIIPKAEARLRELITLTNKNSALLKEREQEIKLRDLKIRELQSKIESLTPTFNAIIRRESERSVQEEIERGKKYMSMAKSAPEGTKIESQPPMHNLVKKSKVAPRPAVAESPKKKVIKPLTEDEPRGSLPNDRRPKVKQKTSHPDQDSVEALPAVEADLSSANSRSSSRSSKSRKSRKLSRRSSKSRKSSHSRKSSINEDE